MSFGYTSQRHRGKNRDTVFTREEGPPTSPPTLTPTPTTHPLEPHVDGGEGGLCVFRAVSNRRAKMIGGEERRKRSRGCGGAGGGSQVNGEKRSERSTE